MEHWVVAEFFAVVGMLPPLSGSPYTVVSSGGVMESGGLPSYLMHVGD